MIEGVDPERYDEVLDRYDAKITTLKKLLKANPNQKNWGKLSNHLVTWAQDDDFKDVVVPYIKEYMPRWSRRVQVSVPPAWYAMLESRTLCYGLALFDVWTLSADKIPLYIANITNLLHVKELTLQGAQDAQPWADLFAMGTFDNLHTVSFERLFVAHDILNDLNAFDTPVLTRLTIKNIPLQLQQVVYIMNHSLIQQCTDLGLIRCRLSNEIAVYILKASDNLLSHLQRLRLNANSEITTRLRQQLIQGIGPLKMGIPTYDHGRHNLNSYFTSSDYYTKHLGGWDGWAQSVPTPIDDDDFYDEYDYEDGWE